MTNSRSAARKESRSDGASAPKSASSRNMGRPSFVALIQEKRGGVLEFVPDGGKGDQLPGGDARIRHAEPVVPQFRQACQRGGLCGAPGAIERQPSVAGEEAD